jgi:phosphoribosyl-ATP pyrophosphohydrolase
MTNTNQHRLEVFANLVETISQRAQSDGDKSYTAQLLGKGIAHCAKKFGEESAEIIIAAVSQDDEALIGEVADVLYHLLVLMESREISLSDVMAELESRTVQSGLAEKTSRQNS